MSDFYVFIFILLALAIGYGIGVYARRKNSSDDDYLPWPQKKYYQGLTYLLNDEPDAAIDAFISAMEVNSDTLETHIALGNLLRRRGEFARAVKVHQNLLARPQLPVRQQRRVQMELAVDYLRSGLLDRAEQLLKDFADKKSKDKEELHQALVYLLEVYQGTREWRLAIDVADRLTVRKFGVQADPWRERQAQYCCELAEEEKGRDVFSAKNWVKSALRYDKKCVRALLIHAELLMKNNEFDEAISVLVRIPKQNEMFLSEMLAPLFECYQSLNRLPDLYQYLKGLYEKSRTVILLQYLLKTMGPYKVRGGKVGTIQEGFSEADSVAFLIKELSYFQSTKAASELLALVFDSGDVGVLSYDRVYAIVEKFTESKVEYQCSSCGFSGVHIHWLCPSCKSWSTMFLLDE